MKRENHVRNKAGRNSVYKPIMDSSQEQEKPCTADWLVSALRNTTPHPVCLQTGIGRADKGSRSSPKECVQALVVEAFDVKGLAAPMASTREALSSMEDDGLARPFRRVFGAEGC